MHQHAVCPEEERRVGLVLCVGRLDVVDDRARSEAPVGGDEAQGAAEDGDRGEVDGSEVAAVGPVGLVFVGAEGGGGSQVTKQRFSASLGAKTVEGGADVARCSRGNEREAAGWGCAVSERMRESFLVTGREGNSWQRVVLSAGCSPPEEEIRAVANLPRSLVAIRVERQEQLVREDRVQHRRRGGARLHHHVSRGTVNRGRI